MMTLFLGRTNPETPSQQASRRHTYAKSKGQTSQSNTQFPSITPSVPSSASPRCRTNLRGIEASLCVCNILCDTRKKPSWRCFPCLTHPFSRQTPIEKFLVLLEESFTSPCQPHFGFKTKTAPYGLMDVKSFASPRLISYAIHQVGPPLHPE